MSQILQIKNSNEILNNNPKATRKLCEWLNTEIQEGGMDTANIMVQLNPRMLYDFFDDMGVHAYPIVLLQNEWNYHITRFNHLGKIDLTASAENTMFPNRIEAEKAMFIKAFEVLNERQDS